MRRLSAVATLALGMVIGTLFLILAGTLLAFLW